MEFFEEMKNFIRPELVVLVPVLYFIGMGLKKAQFVPDRSIPVLLGVFGILLTGLHFVASGGFCSYRDLLLAIFAAITQGILCAGTSVYINQIVKQGGKIHEQTHGDDSI